MKKNKAIQILAEEKDFIVINKPSGILSIPDRFDSTKENVYGLLRETYPGLMVVHRLDKDTSGVLCFALNAASHRQLNDSFANREVTKIYRAICESCPADDSGLISAPIAHSPAQDGKMVIHPKGKEALTKYRVKEHWRQFSLLELKPETGRTHQIRMHLAYIGCPIVCDPLYGQRSSLSIADIKRHSKLTGTDEHFNPLISRTALHAWSLEFNLNGQSHYFEAEMPKDMKALINQLNKWQRID